MFVAACFFQLLSTQYEGIPDSELPGLYHSGFVHSSTSLHLTADRKYVINSSSCLSRSKETGTWIRQGNVIVLTNLESEGRDIKTNQERLVPIRMNHHLYMIEPNSVPAFADQARNSRREAPPFSRYSIKLNEKKPLDEFIESDRANWIPLEYRSYYELGQFRATVVRIIKGQLVEVELSSQYPVQPNTRLGINGPISMDLQIESVKGRTGIAKVWYFDQSDRRVQVGDIFSSTGFVYSESKKRFADLLQIRNP